MASRLTDPARWRLSMDYLGKLEGSCGFGDDNIRRESDLGTMNVISLFNSEWSSKMFNILPRRHRLPSLERRI